MPRLTPATLIGGNGERKTSRLVARDADACNLILGRGDLAHKLDVLRQNCQAEGRDDDEIEKTTAIRFDVGENGERVDEPLAQLRALAGLGSQIFIGVVKNVHALRPLEIMAERVIPAVAGL